MRTAVCPPHRAPRVAEILPKTTPLPPLTKTTKKNVKRGGPPCIGICASCIFRRVVARHRKGHHHVLRPNIAQFYPLSPKIATPSHIFSCVFALFLGQKCERGVCAAKTGPRSRAASLCQWFPGKCVNSVTVHELVLGATKWLPAIDKPPPTMV